MRDEWVAQIGNVDQYGKEFKPYWTSEPFPTRDQAIDALEAHVEVIAYSEQLMRYRMKKDYTRGDVFFRQTEMDQYER